MPKEKLSAGLDYLVKVLYSRDLDIHVSAMFLFKTGQVFKYEPKSLETKMAIAIVCHPKISSELGLIRSSVGIKPSKSYLDLVGNLKPNPHESMEQFWDRKVKIITLDAKSKLGVSGTLALLIYWLTI